MQINIKFLFLFSVSQLPGGGLPDGTKSQLFRFFKASLTDGSYANVMFSMFFYKFSYDGDCVIFKVRPMGNANGH